MRTFRPASAAVPGLLVVLMGCSLPSCSIAHFRAEREVQRSESADGLASVFCKTHNGAIKVRGVQGKATVDVMARLVAHGDDEIEARENVAQLDVKLERSGSELVIATVVPSTLPWQAGASFSFQLEVPAELALRLTTHNGEVETLGTSGDVQAVTHNGGVRVRGAVPVLELTTHNGEIELVCEGSGTVRGNVTTHNGGVTVDVGARSATIEASTHNGHMESSGVRVESRTERRLRAVAGDGQGELRVGTHNGAVRVRSSGV